MAEVRYIDPIEFQGRGYLQEINRLFLHPLGMALEIQKAESGVWEFRGVWDCRDDPEGIAFDDEPSAERAAMVEAERAEKAAARLASLGFDVQPVGAPEVDTPAPPVET